MFSYKKFIIGFIISFYALATLSIKLIPFDYPTWPLLKVLRYQLDRQLLEYGHIYFILPISVVLGIVFSLKLNTNLDMARLLLIFILIIMFGVTWFYLEFSDFVVNNYA
ncbi:hypothetical protein CIB95_08335 [Lottiidibacillus patelloidae]|uniref:Uncharacterized protein n=1 Tax=Lottiidibacillus patelloidae TaxID=2670334 RepID=A0A263BV70_9BACI|nr:hypothetical protein [Lottiidibacillus patelloidae]OZM57452.1 hypothetical protein CIB95_08335 [Lottiidibacillus patelloidae]